MLIMMAGAYGFRDCLYPSFCSVLGSHPFTAIELSQVALFCYIHNCANDIRYGHKQSPGSAVYITLQNPLINMRKHGACPFLNDLGKS